MTPAKIAALMTGGLTAAAIVFVIWLFLIKWLWAWTMGDLFPGAVEQGLIVRRMSWKMAAKVAVLIAFLSLAVVQ